MIEHLVSMERYYWKENEEDNGLYVDIFYKEGEFVGVKVGDTELTVREIKAIYEILAFLEKRITEEVHKTDSIYPLESNGSKEESEAEPEEETKLTWIDAGHFKYAVDGRFLYLRQEMDGKWTRSRRLDYQRVKEIYARLPERSTYKEIIEIAGELGMKIHPPDARLLMHVYSRYVDFDAELIQETSPGRGGKRLVLVKQHDYSLSEEARQRLRQEVEVIGTPWEASE
ncbi:hypothetical protein [Archaeoglobus veneficus]|uniref:Uncharacterized protein n=1 Tax=Archaeoglobus veneficus (strain DSM 11195 / SNP6) TaxID=693661 RepID=F2KR42_ARCVS|nr:hypothetical protein [Archaeoglobus veneficus]AEA46679.1 hypothetical protein Arcve_0659 [Archaeoglobus veneficus SNP6]